MTLFLVNIFKKKIYYFFFIIIIVCVVHTELDCGKLPMICKGPAIDNGTSPVPAQGFAPDPASAVYREFIGTD